MRSEQRVIELIMHTDDAVVDQGIELARSLSARERLAVVARLLEQDDPWRCFAVATTDPLPHTRSFIAWCARSVLPLCAARGLEVAVLDGIIAAVEADPRVVLDEEVRASLVAVWPRSDPELASALTSAASLMLDELRWGAGEAAVSAARAARDLARAEAESGAASVRDGILARSRDPQVAENLYEETRRDSRLRIETAEEEARLLQRTELYRRCTELIR